MPASRRPRDHYLERGGGKGQAGHRAHCRLKPQPRETLAATVDREHSKLAAPEAKRPHAPR